MAICAPTTIEVVLEQAFALIQLGQLAAKAFMNFDHTQRSSLHGGVPNFNRHEIPCLYSDVGIGSGVTKKRYHEYPWVEGVVLDTGDGNKKWCKGADETAWSRENCAAINGQLEKQKNGHNLLKECTKTKRACRTISQSRRLIHTETHRRDAGKK